MSDIHPQEFVPHSEYQIMCNGCGRAVVGDVLLDDETWAKVSRGQYALCILCVMTRLEELKEVVIAPISFQSKWLRTPDSHEDTMKRRRWMTPPGWVAGQPYIPPDKT
jgi:hypothetical protein